MFLARDILRRIEQDGVVERFRTQQSRVLGTLLSQARLERLVEFEAMAERSADAYTLADLMRDLRQGIWSELSAGSVRVNVYRRNVQRAFLDTVDRRLHPTQAELTRANNPLRRPGPPTSGESCGRNCRISTDSPSRHWGGPPTT
jgi:hypothetical protein